MRKLLTAAAIAALVGLCQPALADAPGSGAAGATSAAEPTRALSSNVSPTAAYIVAALADAQRSSAERAQDSSRHPAETLALSGVAPGEKICELLPGEGYFTRLFSDAVGPHGRVYAITRTHPSRYEHPVLSESANVANVSADYDKFTLPEPVDLVFTARNYHDLKILSYQMGDTVGMDRAAFAALKPGGVYVIIDHAALAGSSVDQQHPLHRIDEAQVRREVESVGFIYDGDSQMLRNPADPRTASVFDPSIRGHTDQFFLRFHKPG